MIESQVDGTIYKGSTSDYSKRLEEHNSGRSRYTSRKMPWVLVYVEKFQTKNEALVRERQLKRANPKYLRWLISQPTNLLNR
ncbi:MAG: GIY-YIG nuclease family protein [Cyclobacteriaceae bacterium]|nr:GIY-YIG nuclease family protein [Cyclobacteriaceae bacterium]